MTKKPRALYRAFLEYTGKLHQRATFQLRDYLVPGGKYPYDDLAKDLETALAEGFKVHLLSVSGFLMISGYPPEDEDDTLPWHVCDCENAWFGTAKEALAY